MEPEKVNEQMSVAIIVNDLVFNNRREYKNGNALVALCLNFLLS